MGLANNVKKVLRKMVDGLEDIAHDASNAYKNGEGVSGAAKKTADSVKDKTKKTYNNTREKVHSSETYKNHEDGLGMKFARGFKKGVKGTINHTLRFEDDAERFLGKKISPKAPLVALAFATTLAPVAGTGIKEYQRSKYGEIDGGYSPGTINATSSPTFESPLAYAQSEKGLREVVRNIGGDISRNRADVNAEIVFALHNLRNNGGGM